MVSQHGVKAVRARQISLVGGIVVAATVVAGCGTEGNGSAISETEALAPAPSLDGGSGVASEPGAPEDFAGHDADFGDAVGVERSGLALPPFPELGSFDPYITAEDLPDPCEWATAEFMASFGYDEFEDAGATSFTRECTYGSSEPEGDKDRIVTVSFTTLPNELLEENRAADSPLPGVFVRADKYLEGLNHASVDTSQGNFEVSVFRYDHSGEEREQKALEILETIVGQSA